MKESLKGCDKHQCLHCGEQFVSKRWNAKYCSTHCYSEQLKSDRKLLNKTFDKIICVSCGKEFIPITHSQKCCSKECTKIKDREYKRTVNNAFNKEKICPECGKSFIASGNAQRCSKECYSINRKRLNAPEYKNLHTDFENKANHDKEYYGKNKEKIKPEIKRRHYERLNNDPAYKLQCRLKGRVQQIVKTKISSSNVTKYVGCSYAELLQHLQNTAIKNNLLEFDVTNYNGREYHIDHIKPCVSFDFNKPSDIKECLHYTNLQILKATDNLKKSSKILIDG